MRLHRFYVSQPLGEEVVVKDVSLIKQWSKVFRYNVGTFVILFNGDGNDYHYEITSLHPSEASLVCNSKNSSLLPKKIVHLYLSLIKKDNFELVVQKATELGVSSITPILAEHSEKKGLNKERLEKIVQEASEQSGRGDIPVLEEITAVTKVLESISDPSDTLVLNMDGIPFSDKQLQEKIKASSHVSLLIGPEGGWSDTELQSFKEKGCTFISLGETTLRAETAAIVACALPLLL